MVRASGLRSARKFDPLRWSMGVRDSSKENSHMLVSTDRVTDSRHVTSQQTTTTVSTGEGSPTGPILVARWFCLYYIGCRANVLTPSSHDVWFTVYQFTQPLHA